MSETSFGRYRLVDLLGEGGMGQVYRAYDTETDRVVALKVLPPHLVKDQEYERRFRREAKIVAALNDPHIVPIHHYGEIDGRLYVDMRLIEGRDLAQILKRPPGVLEPARAVHYVAQLAEALHAAHAAGLVHRDVKPSNVLITDRDFVYLIDFGIVQVTGQSRLTETGRAIGTFAYMAPERLSSGAVDSRADVYALACVLYECLTGGPPFAGDSVEQLVAAHLMAPPPRPSVRREGVTPSFDVVVSKGMAKDPDSRYQSTIELALEARIALARTDERNHIAASRPNASNRTIPPHSGHTISAADALHSADTKQRDRLAEPQAPRPIAHSKRLPATPTAGSSAKPHLESRSSRRRSIIAIVGTILGLALICAVVITLFTIGSGSDSLHDRSAGTIKPEGAAGSVTELVSKQTGFKPKDVKCPSGVDAEVGKEFECHFTGPEGADYTAHMKVTKVEGDDVEFYIKTALSK